ncbi:MAG: hypothetical protein FJW23_12410 [Acidimicrobiia bacterium]|nr:hypothetical protein [Acidimicrobiia bacterium]
MAPLWRRSTLCALAGYIALAGLASWPLPLRFDSHLTGPPDGDTGVYVWNQWVFREELLQGRPPYFTDRIFALSPRRANLSLHNYTTFQNLLAVPLGGVFGAVATFNGIYLGMSVLTAWATFLLARAITGAHVESWLAGALFAWCPILITRGNAHVSLVAAAPLAVFALLLHRSTQTQRTRDAVALGACLWWAAAADAYYAVYCLLMAAVFLAAHLLSVDRRRAPVRSATLWALDALLAALAGLVLAIVLTGGWRVTVLGQVISMRGVHTPVLLMTVLGGVRVALRYRFGVVHVSLLAARRAFKLTAVAVLVALVFLGPKLSALAERIGYAGLERGDVFWRSSPRGVDLLAFAIPNPNHPLAPAALRDWLARGPDGYAEAVASLSLVALGVLSLAAWRGWRPPRPWLWITLAFGALALGPFVHVGGFNTVVPGPWALLRYAPVAGLARTPARFSIVVALVLAVLFAMALRWLADRRPSARPALLAVVAALLCFELVPIPRTLYSAAIPRLYAHVAAEPADVRVLELPFGIRDGTSSIGNFTARSQFFQTFHGKALVGGYLSRVSKRRIRSLQADPMLGALIALSENRTLDPALERQLLADGARFATEARLGFVVIDRARASPALARFAIRALRLSRLDADGPLELYQPPPSTRPPA